jgi:hypothetical protein
MDLAQLASRRYKLVQELREFLESKGGPNWRTDPCDLPINFEGVTEHTILVDVKKADKAWSKPKHIAFRISAQGNNEIENRTELLVERFKSGDPIDPSHAHYNKETGGLDFEDGRHRFSLLRDAGVLVLPMNCDPSGNLKELEANPEEIAEALEKGERDKSVPKLSGSRFNNPKKMLEPVGFVM